MLQYSPHLLEVQETFVREYKISFGSLKYASNLIDFGWGILISHTIWVMKHIPLFFFLISYCSWFNAAKAFSQSPSRIDCLNNEAEVFSKVVSDSLTNVRAEFSRPTLNKCWPIRRISSSSRFENFRRPFNLSPSPVTSPFVPFVFPLVILELLK